MFSGLLQDWTTMDGAGIAAFAQARPDWLDLEAYADVLFWLEVRAIQNPGAGSVVLTYETAPALDESLFQPLGAVTLAASAAPVRTEVKSSSAPIPLARFVRWRLAGTAAGNWSVTFRIFTMANKGSSGGFDPASLALTGWWRASYAGAPWTGTASLGTSGAHALATVGADPAVGTAVNGLTPADFNVSYLEDSTDNWQELVSASAYYMHALFYATVADVDGGSPFENPNVLGDQGGSIGMAYSDAGVQVYHYDGTAWRTAIATCAINTWQFVQGWFDGTNIRIRVNGVVGTPSATAADVIDLSGNFIRVGSSYDNPTPTHFFTGQVLEIATSASTELANLDALLAYARARYGLAL